MSKRLSLLMSIAIVLTLALGVFTPVVMAQEDYGFLDEYLTNLPRGYYALTVQDLNVQMVDSPPFLLDVRQPEEYAKGFIEGAVNIPVRDLAQHLDLLPAQDAPIVVYCQGGHRGVLALTALKLLGYQDVQNLFGGIGEWLAADLPLSMDAPEVEAGVAPDVDPALLETVDNYLSNIPQGWGIIKAEDLNVRLAEEDNLYVLDVRTRREVAAGFIEGVEVIEIHDVAKMADMLPEDKSTPVVVYCGTGYRSAFGVAALWLMGYENALSLSGGIRAWTGAEYPTVRTIEAVADYYLHDLLPEGWGMISAEDLNAQIEADAAPFLLDVRQPEEYEGGFIAGAVNVPLREVAQHLDLLPADMEAPIVVYCAAGHRGALAMTALQMLGYANVKNLAGGYNGWVALEYPTTTEPAPAAEPAAVEVDAFVLEATDAALSTIPEGWGTITPDALSEALAADSPPVLIDVRQPEEWVADGVIEGATLIPLRELATNADQWPADKDAPIVVYCKSGHRGAIAMEVLRTAGYTDVRNLAGGFNGWSSAGMPVATAE